MILERKASTKKSADFISNILAEFGAVVFSFALQEMDAKEIVISKDQIQRNIYDLTAMMHAKRLMESSAHLVFL